MASVDTYQCNRSQVLEFAGAALGCAVELSRKLPSSGNSMPTHYALLCHCAVMHDATACHLLMSGGLWSASSKILRSMIESVLHLNSVVADENYVYCVIREVCKTMQREIKNHEKGNVSRAHILSEAQIEKHKKTLESFNEMLPPGLEDKATLKQYKDANLESYYVYSYTKYSRVVHCNLLALLDGHSQGTFCTDVVITKDCTELEFLTQMCEFVDLLRVSISKVLTIFMIDLDTESSRFMKQLVLCHECIEKEIAAWMEAN